MLHAPTSSDPPVSAWTPAAEPLPVTRPLEGDRRADVVIVGAGYTGLSAALHLADRSAEVVVLDAAEPGWGGSGRNGGQVIAGVKDDPDELERKFGSAMGRRMWQNSGAAADFVFELIARHRSRVTRISPAGSARPPMPPASRRCAGALPSGSGAMQPWRYWTGAGWPS